VHLNKETMKRIILFLLIIFSLNAFSQTSTKKNVDAVLLSSNNPVQICSDSLVWNDVKPPLPPGAKVAVLEGNPKESGHFTIRIKMPANYKIAPHVHPVDERATVLSGTMYIGFGDTMDEAKAKKIPAGCFYLNPAGVHHYAFTGKEETILQISTNGPWGLNYLENIKH
jgi:mannose-6-phosphate isomerase-like protein (cupin superfamily)